MTKLKTYYQVYKMQITRCLTYKFDVYGNIIMQSIIMIASAFFWKALFKNSVSKDGIDVNTMLIYTVISSIISVVLTSNVERRIEGSVIKGTIAIDMMRPVDIYKVFFAENLASITALFFQNLLPILLIGSLLIKVPKPASLEAFLLFLLSLILAFFLNWFMSLCFGMFAFKVYSMDALIQVKKHLIRLLSGSIIPIWFFPDKLRAVLECMPFVYLYQLPLDFYIGKYDHASLVRGFFVQLVWLGIFIGLFSVMKRRITKYLMIQGG